MEALRTVPDAAAQPVDDFELAYIRPEGVEVRQDLAASWAVPLEASRPVRQSRPSRRTTHGPAPTLARRAAGTHVQPTAQEHP